MGQMCSAGPFAHTPCKRELHRPNLSPHPTYYVENYYLRFLLLFNIVDYIKAERLRKTAKRFLKEWQQCLELQL